MRKRSFLKSVLCLLSFGVVGKAAGAKKPVNLTTGTWAQSTLTNGAVHHMRYARECAPDYAEFQPGDEIEIGWWLVVDGRVQYSRERWLRGYFGGVRDDQGRQRLVVFLVGIERKVSRHCFSGGGGWPVLRKVQLGKPEPNGCETTN